MASKKIPLKQIEKCITDLRDLSYNLWWSWHPEAQEVFHELSPFFWEQSTHNPVEVMHWVHGPELHGRLEQKPFFDKVMRICTDFRKYMGQKKTWAAKNATALRKGGVAYFSAEFGLHECLRIYSGGLGILAGDHAKSASDLGIPFHGISLFYRQGYFQQQISDDGWQHERYPSYDPAHLPLSLLKDRKGNAIVCTVDIDNATVYFQAWEVAVGRAKVFLLDTNLPQNDQRFRDLTAHVYGGDQTNRIGQEILLGIGGVRLLRAMNIEPDVFHMNEGHAAFLTLELLREQLANRKQLPQAEEYVKARCIFTTHTPVPAGHDRFDRGLMEANLSRFASSLGLQLDQVMRYGRIHPDDPFETFTMTVLALKLSRAANGVSELHGKTSCEMWKDLFPGTPVEKIPIGHVTNGIHTSGWASPIAGEFWRDHLGPQWAEKLQDPQQAKKILFSNKISDQDLWRFRLRLRRRLVEYSRKKLREQHMRLRGFDPGTFETALAPDVLTIGFARRFATYKRAPLFFRDYDWAFRILNDRERPVQIIFAGKAHPRDDAGKQFIQQIVQLMKRGELFGKVVFLEDYSIEVARYLVAGADLWLNTPRRPMEACGTSGQKVGVHGGIQLSTMDGWWREAYNGENGWKIGEDSVYSNEAQQDDIDAASLRHVLEFDVIPCSIIEPRTGFPTRGSRK